MKQTDTKNKKRLFYLITALLLLMTEVLIALFVHDRFIRPYAGDILVVLLIYALVRIFFRNGLIYCRSMSSFWPPV